MTKRSGSNQRQLGRAVTIRIDEAMDQAIVHAAGDQTRGNWLRFLIAEKLGTVNAPAKRKSAGGKRVLQSSREDLAVLRALAITSARSIGILKLTARQMRLSNEPRLHNQAESTLTEMQATAHEIQTLLRDLESEP